jgi:hemoglobin/transferrin/lactoferrin receptor protein
MYTTKPNAMKTYYLLLLLSFSLAAQAQIIDVVDKVEQKPIANVLIINQKQDKQALTNAKGKADLAAFADGDTLLIRHAAYVEQRYAKPQLAALAKVLLTEKIINLEEVVFSANKFAEARTDLPNKIEMVDARHIAFYNPQTAGDLLRQTGNVFVQTSQMGGGSPVLRGFEASRVLLVVDGVRMNNAIYRSGHLQNVITLDPNILEKAEVVFGPGSVIYGSDALGGVMHFFTRNPEFSDDGKLKATGAAFTRVSSANSEWTGNAVVNLAVGKWASLTSVTHKHFGEQRAGTVYPKGYANIWARPVYPAFINGRDTALVNLDLNLQKWSGYSQLDLLQKIAFQPHDDNRFMLNVQYSTSSDVPRTDRYGEYDSRGLPRWAVWDYGPQKRLLASLRADFLGQTEFYDKASVILAWQNIFESRITRRFGAANRTHREETVNVFSVNADMMKDIGERHELRYGLEMAHNDVQSLAYNINVRNQTRTAASTRYPDGGSQTQSFALYLTHAWEMGKNRQIVFSQGLRYQYITLSSRFLERSFYPFPFNAVEQRNNAFTGNLGMAWNANGGWRFSALLSSGFRSPNVDDLGKIFDSTPGNVILPNPNIKPEYVYNAEMTISKNIKERFFAELTGFHSWFTNALVVRNGQFNGQDSVVYDNVKSRVQTITNANQAIVYGLQATLKAQLAGWLSMQSNLTWTRGRVTSEGVPLDHIPPLYGQTSVTAALKKWRGEFWMQYNGWKRRADYSPSGEDNLQYATPDGMPAWTTLNWRMSYQLNQWMQLQGGIDNIADRHYRLFASGISAPGRNFYATIRVTF